MQIALNTLSSVTGTAGTATPLVASNVTPPVWARAIVIQAKGSNTGSVFVGDSTVKNDGTAGHELTAGGTFEYDLMYWDQESINLADIYINTAVTGEGVNVSYIKHRGPQP